MSKSGKIRQRTLPLLGLATMAGLLFVSTASAWTYDDLDASQKKAYDHQQTVLDNFYARFGFEDVPQLPLAIYLGTDTRGSDEGEGNGEGSGEDEGSGQDNGEGINHGSKGGITDIHVLNRGDQQVSDRGATYGQVFKKGDYQPSKTLYYSTPSNPSAQAVQSDIKTYWDDGSVQHAILTFQLDDVPAGDTRALNIFTRGKGDNRASSDNRSLTIRDLLATNFNATATVHARDGREFTSDARKILQAIADKGGCDQVPEQQCRTWLSGNLASEWIVGGRLAGTHGTRENQMGVYFHVRAYANNSGQINNARVDTVFENGFTYAKTASNLNYRVKLDVGDQQFASGKIKHYNHARWHKTLWWGSNPNLYVHQDTEYLQDTGVIPEYEDIQPRESELKKIAASFPIMTNGNQTQHMGNTGAQAAIGPLPSWTALYALSGDARAFDHMNANDNAVGSYGFHYRDAATGRPVSIEDHPFITLADYSHATRAGGQYQKDLITPCSDDCSSPYSFDIAHHPSIGYVPYLVTGDYYFLEELQFAASYDQLWANPKYRGESKGHIQHAQGQVRGQAWTLRTMAQAAFASPKNDPMKSFFTQMMQNNIDNYTAYYLDNEAEHPLHLIDNYGAVIYPAFGQSRVGVGPWQQDFFAWSVSNAADLGFAGYDKFAKWLLQFQVGRMTNWLSNKDGGFCWINAATYSLQIRPYQNGPQYQTLDEAYRASMPALVGLRCDSQGYRNRLSGYYGQGEMTGYAHSATGFPSNFQPALAASVDMHVKDADTAWQIFDSRAVKPSGYDIAPQFAIMPRR